MDDRSVDFVSFKRSPVLSYLSYNRQLYTAQVFYCRANASNFSTPCYYLKKAVLKFLVVLYECQKHL
ncbi:MAG TPA: hypothetical protein DDW84_04915 [Phycisphaerales bacterium]|nr:MAG: hypothetical protein A2Y13_09965 [Planctomycetes bacterium GWC2_45_44]HBG78178.1 hypothetical protein [Phycisphaerales bacterium]